MGDRHHANAFRRPAIRVLLKLPEISYTPQTTHVANVAEDAAVGFVKGALVLFTLALGCIAFANQCIRGGIGSLF